MKYQVFGGPMDGREIELPEQVHTVKFPIPSTPTAWDEGLEPTFDAVECEVDPRGVLIWPRGV